MAQPYIRINQFEANYSDVGVKSATGHVNFTFIDGNGVNKGTFGANLKGFINKNDEIYASLRVWVNHQMDGISHAGEIFTLQELGVERINTDFDIIDFVDENNNLIGERSTAIIHGIEREMSEVYFTYL